MSSGSCQSPLLAIIKSVPEVRALCSAGITRPHSSYGPVRRPRGSSPKVTLRARPSSPPDLPRLPVSLFQRAVPTTRRTRTGAHVGCFPVPRGLPLISGGSASATSLSRPAQASLELRPVGSLNRPRRPLSQGFDPSGYPDKPPASYQIKPTTVWVVPSSTSDTRLLGARGVEERRGGLGPMGITPFPLPAHQTGRADFPHPASRPASPQSTRRWAKMDPTLSDHTELPEHDRIGETWCHATTPYGA